MTDGGEGEEKLFSGALYSASKILLAIPFKG